MDPHSPSWAPFPLAYVSTQSVFLFQPQSSQLVSLIDWLEMSPSMASCLMTLLGGDSDLIKSLCKTALCAIISCCSLLRQQLVHSIEDFPLLLLASSF